MSKIYLATTSPRRIALLKQVGLSGFEVLTPEIVEILDSNLAPEDSVAFWSRKKAESVKKHVSHEDIIIAADTLVWCNGKIVGKPADEDDAFRTLLMLSGNWHCVYTGVTIMRGDEVLTEEEMTSVLIRNLSPKQIREYVATGEPMDKAGSYGIQERGALLCERVDGDFYNVMGLPVFRLSIMLEQMGIDIFSGTDDGC